MIATGLPQPKHSDRALTPQPTEGEEYVTIPKSFFETHKLVSKSDLEELVIAKDGNDSDVRKYLGNEQTTLEGKNAVLKEFYAIMKGINGTDGIDIITRKDLRGVKSNERTGHTNPNIMYVAYYDQKKFTNTRDILAHLHQESGYEFQPTTQYRDPRKDVIYAIHRFQDQRNTLCLRLEPRHTIL